MLDAVAEQVKELFSTLIKKSFPINKSLLMENYQGDDKAAMDDNNTSAFNGRPITGGTSWSKHAYGVAIDINPLQNPYISFNDNGTAKILPTASTESFINRNNSRPGKEQRLGMAEEVVDIFAQHGFLIWGGDWNSPIDYQHFEIGSRGFINTLIKQPPDTARLTFNRYAQNYRNCVARSNETTMAKKRIECVKKVSQ